MKDCQAREILTRQILFGCYVDNLLPEFLGREGVSIQCMNWVAWTTFLVP